MTKLSISGRALAGTARRMSSTGRALVSYLGAAPLTVTIVTVLWVVGIITGTVFSGSAPHPVTLTFATGPDLLWAGQWWTIVTSLLWCTAGLGYVYGTLLLLLFVAPAERRNGTLRIALLVVIVQGVGVVLTAGVVQFAAWLGDEWTEQLAGATHSGPGPLAVGVALASTSQFGPLWRRRLRLILLIAVTVLAAYAGSLSDLQCLVTALVGLTAGPWVLGRPARTGHRSLTASWAERRVLIALVVAGSAVGPIVAALASTPIGPLSVLRYVFLTAPPDASVVQQVCADPSTADDCRALEAQLRLSGVGPALMTVVPVVLLLIAADGLRRGRRAAWLAALSVNLVLVCLAAVLATDLFDTPIQQRTVFGGLVGSQTVLAILLPLLVPAVIAGVLWWNRLAFDVRTPPATARRMAWVVVGTAVGLSAVYLAGGLLLREQFDRPPSPLDLLIDLPTRFIPPGYLGEIPPRFLPTDTWSTALYELTGVVFYGVVAVGLLITTRRSDTSAASEPLRRRASEICRTVGGSSLSHLTTWSGNNYRFAISQRSYLAYRVVGNIAVSVTDPVGPPAERGGAVIEFASWCAQAGLTPCLYSVTTATRDLAVDRYGWRSVQVAEETRIPLPGLAFTGKKWQDVRTALNKAARNGVTGQWWTYREAPFRLTEQVKAISEEWVADRGLPEMGFTLGGLDELADPEVQCLFAVDPHHVVQAIASFMPVRRDGTTVGWTLDFMRRRSDSFPGAMEFLIATAALRFQADGAEFLSLSGAPLARIDRGADLDPVQRLLDVLGHALEPVYGFRSLFDFKSKFQPEYEPLWMVYPDPVALPAIAGAIGRCYLPHLRAGQAARLMGRLATTGRKSNASSAVRQERG